LGNERLVGSSPLLFLLGVVSVILGCPPLEEVSRLQVLVGSYAIPSPKIEDNLKKKAKRKKT
jgi:hypothetical protein